MSNQGLSENKLEELRKQREEAKRQKAEKEQQEKLAEEQRKLQEKQEQEKLQNEKEAEIQQLKAEKQRLEEEKKQRDEKEREEKEKQIAELKAEKEELKAEKKRLEEERKAEKLRMEEEKKAEKKRLEEEKKAEKLKAQEEAKKQKEQKKAKKTKDSKKQEEVVEEPAVEEAKNPVEEVASPVEEVENPVEENNQVAEDAEQQEDKEKTYSTNVQVVSDEAVIIDKEVFEEGDDEEGKVQVGYTMVDKSLVSQAKGNQRYGIKERSEVYKKLNTIVFYIAIPLMLIWTIIAFGGICTARVGHTSFADNVYYKVPDNVTILSEETTFKYKTGDVLSVKNVDLSKLEKGDILCIEYTLPGTKEHRLYLVRVTSSESVDSAGNYNVLVNTDVEDEYLSAVISTSEKGNSLGNAGIRYLGVVTGKSIIMGQFLMFCQNIVVFIFLVAIPAVVILTFQFINLYDGLRIYIKQRQIGKAKNKQKKKVDNRDKIKR